MRAYNFLLKPVAIKQLVLIFTLTTDAIGFLHNFIRGDDEGVVVSA